MKSFVLPEMKILGIALNENIAASGDSTGTAACPLGLDGYSATKQQCVNCKLYYYAKGSYLNDVSALSSGTKTFSDNYGLGYSSGDEAKLAADGMSCPAGLG